MSQFRLWLSLSLSLFLYSGLLAGQTPSPSSGEITVQLIQGLDSATNPRGISQGKVTKSTNPAVPVGTTAIMGLGSDSVNGGYTVKLVRLDINGQMVLAASSDVVTAPDFFNKMQERTRAKGQPQDAASGTRVFLPEKMIVRFTLAAPPPPRPAAASSPPPLPVQTRVAPRHPAPTVVDLQPAFSGAPPLHASKAANDGCWWEPFGAKALGFELPVQRCTNPATDAVVSETATGLSVRQGGTDISVGFAVLSKPATQPIEAAIKTQFLKKPSDRTACVVKKYDNLGEIQSYGVVAPHSTRTDCAGLYQSDSDATESTTFFYNPADAKTKYVKFVGEYIGAYPFDFQAFRFLESQGASASDTTSANTNPLAKGPSGSAPGETASSSLPAGPVAPVNRLNVRGISVRMGRGQIIAAAKAANMNVLSNVPQQIKLVDPTASGKPVGGASSLGGSGLVLLINMKDDRAITIYVNEQGDMNGHVFEDIQKKWGVPKGKDDVGPYWGDLNGVYADYDSNMYGFLGMHVTIQDKAAFPAPPKRQAVPM